jgi:hypothetical protein
MHLVQLLLPLYTNAGIRFEQKLFVDVRRELVNRFGGITAYTRAPVEGLWQDSDRIIRDDLLIYEIMLEGLDESWWREYRVVLENRFHQEALVIRTHDVRLL